MKKSKSILVIVFALMISLGFTGCFKEVQRAKIDPEANTSSKIQLSILLPFVSQNMNDNKAIPLINEITGYNTTYEQLPSGASAETSLTSLFVDRKTDYHALKLTKNQFNKYAVQAAALADMTDALNSTRFKPIKDAIKPEAWQAVTYDGKILGIPDSASNDNIDKTIIIRKDIMLSLGITKLPETLEEFKDLLIAFKNSKSGNNTAFTVPNNIPLVGPVAAACGVEQMWQEENGNLVNAIETAGISDYVTYMKTLKSENLLDVNMQQNSFETCAENFASGKSIATICNFWEAETISLKLAAKGGTLINDVAFAYGFKNQAGEVKTWQSSGTTYVTVVPNWMANTGTHVLEYVKSKIQPDNFARIVAGDLGTHYQKNYISNEWEPLAQFKVDKTSADHFVTGTNDNVYNQYWTQVVIKGNANYYTQWKATNTDAFNNGLIGIKNPLAFAPALKKYSASAAGIEDIVLKGITNMIYGNDSSVTIQSIKNNWQAGDNAAAIQEVKNWYKNK